MFDRKVVRRRRAALAVLVGLSLLLLTVTFGGGAGGPLSAIQRGAQEIFQPIEEGASRVFKPVGDLVGWFGDAINAKKENKQLKNERADLRKRVAELETERRDAEQLGGLDAIKREDGFPQGYDTVTARVIARSPTVWYSAIQIDAGSGDGVREDAPVITGDGLIGKVTTVTGGTARVELITNQGSAVSAQVMPVGANGIVKPEVGSPRDLLLEFVQKGRRVRRGQTVVTSGFTSSKVDSLFPRGIPIGKVSRVEADEVELYQRVHIEPYADLRRTDFVDVLMPRNGERAQTP